MVWMLVLWVFLVYFSGLGSLYYISLAYLDPLFGQFNVNPDRKLLKRRIRELCPSVVAVTDVYCILQRVILNHSKELKCSLNFPREICLGKPCLPFTFLLNSRATVKRTHCWLSVVSYTYVLLNPQHPCKLTYKWFFSIVLIL